MQLETLLQQQRTFFIQQNTKPIAFRIQATRRLKEVVQRNEKAICEVLYLDLPYLYLSYSEAKDKMIRKFPK